MAKQDQTPEGKSLRKEGQKWITRINDAQAKERHWIDNADKATKIFAGDTVELTNDDSAFNILYSNVETIVPAIINSPPVPDIRRRFGEKDEAARDWAEAQERVMAIQVDDSRLQIEMEAAAQDSFLAGRGIVRLRYMSDVVEEEVEEVKEAALEDSGITTEEDSADYESEVIKSTGEVNNERITFEAVSWRDYAHGPAKRWEHRPWDAFRHAMPLEDVEAFQDQAMVAGQMETDEDKQSSGESDSDLVIWEVWCKNEKKVKFISEVTGVIIKVIDDPLGLTQFFPIATPIQPVEITGRLMPVNPYSVYKALAEELDVISKRIIRITDQVVAKGWYPGEAVDLESVLLLGDGEFAPIKDAEGWAAHGGLEKAIAFWPFEKFAIILKELYAARDQTKQAIYEITGISDIVRGASKASETLGAQQIKSQWGSLRIQKAQRSMERAARDLFVMMAEVIPEKFSIETIEKMAAMQLQPTEQEMQPLPLPQIPEGMPPEEAHPLIAQYQAAEQERQQTLAKYARIAELMNEKSSSYYAINVESQSTVRSDLTQQKAEVSEFLNASAAYFQAVAPLVNSGEMPPTVAIEVYAANSRLFNLGRSTEAAIDEMVEMANEKAKAPPPPEEPNVDMLKLELEKEKLGLEQQKMQGEAQFKTADMELRNKEFELKFKEVAGKAMIEELKIKQQSDIDGVKSQLDIVMSQLDVKKSKLEVEKVELEVEGKSLDNAGKEVDLINSATGDNNANV